MKSYDGNFIDTLIRGIILLIIALKLYIIAVMGQKVMEKKVMEIRSQFRVVKVTGKLLMFLNNFVGKREIAYYKQDLLRKDELTLYG